jgi:hypothetical protein
VGVHAGGEDNDDVDVVDDHAGNEVLIGGTGAVPGREYWYGRRTLDDLSDTSLTAGDGVLERVANTLSDGEGVRDWIVLNCCSISEEGSCCEVPTGQG